MVVVIYGKDYKSTVKVPKLTVQSEYGKYALFALTFSEAPTLHQVTKMLEDKPKL